MIVFNGINNVRYRIEVTYNAPQFTYSMSYPAGSNWETSLFQTTYANVIGMLQKHFVVTASDDQDALPPSTSAIQIYRNHITTLHSFLAFHGKTEDSRVGLEMRQGFNDAVRSYLSAMTLAKRTKKDRRTHLGKIKALIEGVKAPSLKKSKSETSLVDVLRTAVASSGLSAKALATRAGISTSAIQRWLAGATPNKTGITGLHRLESHLGLERNTLVSLLPEEKFQTFDGNIKPAFNQLLGARIADEYYIKEEQLSEAFLEEWRKFMLYKTATVSRSIKRTPRGVWRVIPIDSSTLRSSLAIIGNSACPSADMALSMIRSFFGYLSRPIERGGYGVPLDKAMTISWFAHPEALDSYLEFLKARSGHTVHGGHEKFASFAASLVRKEVGYLRQQPTFINLIPTEFLRCEDWSSMCDEVCDIVENWKQSYEGKHRNPVDSIKYLLAQKEPLRPLLDTVSAIEQAACSCYPDSVQEAIHRRDALLISLLISNPLRARTFVTMTWNSGNTGNLYRTYDGQWRIRLEAFRIKNAQRGRRKATARRYDVKVADWVVPKIEAYLDGPRAVLLDGSESQYLFASSSGKQWKDLVRRVPLLTKRYIPGCSGVPNHGFRHIVGTDWLTKYPNDFVTVAELLNDKFTTVLEEYAHLKLDHSFSRYEEYVSGLGRSTKSEGALCVQRE